MKKKIVFLTGTRADFGQGKSAIKFENIISKKFFWKTKIQKGFVDKGFGATH